MTSNYDVANSGAQSSNGPSLVGTALSGAVGAGGGFGTYSLSKTGKAETLAKQYAEISEDEFRRRSSEEIQKKNPKISKNKLKKEIEKDFNEGYEKLNKASKEALENFKKVKIKFVAGGAIALTAVYLAYHQIKYLLSHPKQ